MYKGFDVSLQEGLKAKLDKKREGSFDAFVKKGRDVRNKARRDIEAKIVSGKWVLNGNDIESNWFPQLQNHIFISHSHKDENLALAMVGMLKHCYDLDVFVDSAVWGYYAELQDRMYDKIVKMRGISSNEKKIELKNSIASHVHCMLTKSLIQMMDQCECLMFLNTPSSICIRDVKEISQETYSPWIYTEIEVSRFLQKHLDARRFGKMLIKESMEYFDREEDVKDIVSYPLNLDHLDKLDEKAFFHWLKSVCGESKGHDAQINPFFALDKLYTMA